MEYDNAACAWATELRASLADKQAMPYDCDKRRGARDNANGIGPGCLRTMQKRRDANADINHGRRNARHLSSSGRRALAGYQNQDA